MSKIYKNFYSGFCFENEKEIFKEYLIENDFTISGFSYGSIKALEELLHTKKRIDLLQLFSPAFFQEKDEKFKRMQIIFFKKNPSLYYEEFLKNASFKSNIEYKRYFKKGTLEELKDLLFYVWDKDKLQELINKGLKIEVYLGSEDKIINSKAAKKFFKNYARVYTIKEKGHFL